MGDAEANTVLVAANLLPGDLEVLRTHVADTSVKLEFLAADEDTGRLTAAGLGEGFPVASNDNEAGRTQNRRVEMYVRN